MSAEQPLIIGGSEFQSRLFVGTGKFASAELMSQALIASGTQMVTAALRRVDLADPQDSIISALELSRYRLLPNTSGARDAQEAVRLARLAKAIGGYDWIKLEVTPQPNHLLPDPIETFKAAKILIEEGFTVLPYINSDPVLALRLEEIGCATVMPLASPIGTNRGIKNRNQIAMIIEQATIPVVVDAGLGLPSHAAQAIEMGADAVLVNTAIAIAEDPIRMAKSFRLGVEAGTMARLAHPAVESKTAQASSPLTGFLSELS